MRIWEHIKTIYNFLSQGFVPYKNIQAILQEKQKIYAIRNNFITKVRTSKNTLHSILGSLLSVSFLLSIAAAILNLLYLGLTLAQPAFNNYIKQIISLDNSHDWASVAKTICYICCFKLLSSLIVVANDTVQQFLGVRIYSVIASLIMSGHWSQKNKTDAKLITMFQDDCQRLVMLPYALITMLLKNIEFIFFVGFIISKIEHYKQLICIIYTVFFVICLVIAYCSFMLNMRILKYKQGRLNFQQLSIPQIRSYRQRQSKSIKKLMILDGITIYLPQFVNIMVMILIYSLEILTADNKYVLLIIFGLLRINISGIGFTYNLLAQIYSSSSRILDQFKINNVPRQLIQIQIDGAHQQNYLSSEILRTNKIQISKIITQIQQNFSHFKICLITLILLVNITYFLYGFCVKSLTTGGSILQAFNLAVLIMQFMIPGLLFTYICFNSSKLSNSIYQKMLMSSDRLTNLSSQELNRLSGDMRQLDRLFYLNAHHNFTSISRVLSSIMFTAVELNSLLISFGYSLFVVITFVGLGYLFRQIMNIRRFIYRSQILSKGEFLQNFKNNLSIHKKWVHVHNFKQYGYLVQNLFILILYVVVCILICILIALILILGISKQTAIVLVMVSLQLDSQLFIVCINWIQFEISLTSVQRCVSLVDNIKQIQINNHIDSINKSEQQVMNLQFRLNK